MKSSNFMAPVNLRYTMTMAHYLSYLDIPSQRRAFTLARCVVMPSLVLGDIKKDPICKKDFASCTSNEAEKVFLHLVCMCDLIWMCLVPFVLNKSIYFIIGLIFDSRVFSREKSWYSLASLLTDSNKNKAGKAGWDNSSSLTIGSSSTRYLLFLWFLKVSELALSSVWTRDFMYFHGTSRRNTNSQ